MLTSGCIKELLSCVRDAGRGGCEAARSFCCVLDSDVAMTKKVQRELVSKTIIESDLARAKLIQYYIYRTIAESQS